MSRAAVFLDRDGTIITDASYLSDPEGVTLLDRAGEALKQLRDAGYPIVVVTNQSGIGRGYFGWDQYYAVAAQLDQVLEVHGGAIDRTYVCPHAPDPANPCDCRKPGLGLYRAAITDLDLDPTRSWWVGDRISDLLPASALGGSGILVLTGEGPAHAKEAQEQGFSILPDLWTAAERILATRD